MVIYGISNFLEPWKCGSRGEGSDDGVHSVIECFKAEKGRGRG